MIVIFNPNATDLPADPAEYRLVNSTKGNTEIFLHFRSVFTLDEQMDSMTMIIEKDFELYVLNLPLWLWLVLLPLGIAMGIVTTGWHPSRLSGYREIYSKIEYCRFYLVNNAGGTFAV